MLTSSQTRTSFADSGEPSKIKNAEARRIGSPCSLGSIGSHVLVNALTHLRLRLSFHALGKIIGEFLNDISLVSQRQVVLVQRIREIANVHSLLQEFSLRFAQILR